MSQVLRSDLECDLCEIAAINENEVHNMSDAEVEYYHWLYLEESIHDLM